MTLSSTEAEYVALGEVTKEVLFMRGILKFIQPNLDESCTTVYEDNQGAIQLANNPLSSSNSKHIDVRHHFLREMVSEKKIRVVYLKSADQHADMMTKALPAGSFIYHRNALLNIK